MSTYLQTFFASVYKNRRLDLIDRGLYSNPYEVPGFCNVRVSFLLNDLSASNISFLLKAFQLFFEFTGRRPVVKLGFQRWKKRKKILGILLTIHLVDLNEMFLFVSSVVMILRNRTRGQFGDSAFKVNIFKVNDLYGVRFTFREVNKVSRVSSELFFDWDYSFTIELRTNAKNSVDLFNLMSCLPFFKYCFDKKIKI